jgi:hypothetical protein
LRVLQPGTQKLVVEAAGFDPHVLTLDLIEGEQRVEGPIRLVPAKGNITVNLTGMKEGLSYSVILFQPGGLALKVIRDIEGDEVTLKNLPSRAYVVACVVGKGGEVASANVDLSGEDQDIVVSLDVSSITEEK